ncbi:type II toxin-antitoxin system RelE/ParE family toxin [Xaviernesmea oryzae]|uniref:type II toxin-antitoxin system RelE/ParE family toxin n=1 Tax=Xaviernesmea oryzae TaxID=464029 RepID=UPI00094FCAA3|nr:type II toxin-antitoxin system RelE/ParE family toxin [Xaviernesmea oryzae]
MKVALSEQAWGDLLEIGQHIAAHNSSRASSFIDELYEACLGLASLPYAFPVHPDYTEEGIRRRIFRRYVIFYRVQAEKIEILHILHGARDHKEHLT